MDNEAQGALIQLRAYLTQQNLPASTRLPAERELCEILGVSRGELRKALAILEGHGELWRHVGKGTFIGARPGDEFAGIAEIAAGLEPPRGDACQAADRASARRRGGARSIRLGDFRDGRLPCCLTRGAQLAPL